MRAGFFEIFQAGKASSQAAAIARGHVLPLVAIVILLAVLAPVPVSAQDSGECDLPFQEDQVRQKYLLWPLVSEEEGPDWRQFSILPFYVKREDLDINRVKVQFLWPLYEYRRQDEDVMVRIFPVYTYWRDVYQYGDTQETQSEYMLLPIIFGGSSSESGDYFAVFPIGGKLKNFLGRDEITFVLFPLYMSYTKDELRQKNYLWPVLSFTEGGGYSGFRIWPLVGRYEKEDEYRKGFFLWPIFNHQVFDLGREQPGERVIIFPLFAKEDSARRYYRAWLWPFFTYERNYAANFTERGTPWPFIVIARGDKERTQLWPIYGRLTTSDSESVFVAWPFWHHDWHTTPTGTKVNSMLMPVFSSSTNLSDKNEVLFHKSRLWPLWRFRRYEDGTTYLAMPSLLWFDDEQGFERHYAPLWTLYERQTTPWGDTKTYAFWRLYRHEESLLASKSEIPFVFNFQEDSQQDCEKLEILKGLIGVQREGDQHSFRILYFLNL